MEASELFRAGRLSEALAAQLEFVKTHPTDQGARVFLFELAAFAGDLDRARRQLDAVPHDSAAQEAAAAAYRGLLDAEAKRRRSLRQGFAPLLLADPPEHVQQRLDALLLLKEQRPTEAAELLETANRIAPEFTGMLNNKPFRLLRDADDLFAHLLEVMALGEYYWVALEQVRELAINPPKTPRDLLYVPARLVVDGGLSGEVFLPALYPFSHEHPDDAVKLGRATDWRADDCGPTLGVGQRVFLVDDDAVPLLEWRAYGRAGVGLE
jgi:type VI secretion system protein ImpE